MEDAKRILKLLVLVIAFFGLVYPLAFIGIARITPSKADGGIVEVNGRPVGAKNIGQEFTSPQYFHGRPSEARYDAMASGASNLALSNPELIIRVQERLNRLLEENPGLEAEDVPLEMVTGSASGLDPAISPESAYLQVPRIAESTGLSEDTLDALIARYTQGRFIGIFGERRVNVLELNLEIRKMLGEE
jgi:potassium-transporting ATPase KdpC subunit